MKKTILLIFVTIIVSCSTSNITNQQNSISINYDVDVSDPSDDLFHVTINVNGLTASNNIYNMPATVPGTYQIMNFGRFVKDFKAYDYDGNEVTVTKTSINTWEISKPEIIEKIEYLCDDTFDAEIKENVIPPMGGSSIDEKYVALNTFCVLGYFEGLQSHPLSLEIEYPGFWEVGTALEMNSDGAYFAETYDLLADSPIFMGNLSVAETMVGNMPVEVYVYSTDSEVTAPKILEYADEVLQSAEKFIGYDAAPRYKFLMLLPDPQTFAKMKTYGGGALEHSLSSFYVMPGSEQALPGLKSTMAHEFLHILTPLNLHSEIIHEFNFINPEPSQHIWLYEGVTEWASDIMQLRGGIMNYKNYFAQIGEKMLINSGFFPQKSLVDMALYSYEEDGYGHFFNFYNKGALTAACLDIELLKLSDGKRGLREVYMDLLHEYGKDKQFPENGFFKIFVDKTYPEIGNFIEKYIKDTVALPVKEYFADMGFKYIQERASDDTRPTIGTQLSINQDHEIIILLPSKEAMEYGLRDYDVLVQFEDTEITLETIQKVMMELFSKKVGDSYKAKVRRGDKIVEINGTLLQRKDYNIFEEMENITPEQQKLRDVWSVNI